MFSATRSRGNRLSSVNPGSRAETLRDAGWLANPSALRRIYEQGVAALNTLSADTPSLRLLADQTADALGGVSREIELGL